jgi:hypothetical protein
MNWTTKLNDSVDDINVLLRIPSMQGCFIVVYLVLVPAAAPKNNSGMPADAMGEEQTKL